MLELVVSKGGQDIGKIRMDGSNLYFSSEELENMFPDIYMEENSLMDGSLSLSQIEENLPEGCSIDALQDIEGERLFKLPENPEFEKKHPRAQHGRFRDKPDELIPGLIYQQPEFKAPYTPEEIRKIHKQVGRQEWLDAAVDAAPTAAFAVAAVTLFAWYTGKPGVPNPFNYINDKVFSKIIKDKFKAQIVNDNYKKFKKEVIPYIEKDILGKVLPDHKAGLHGIWFHRAEKAKDFKIGSLKISKSIEIPGSIRDHELLMGIQPNQPLSGIIHLIGRDNEIISNLSNKEVMKQAEQSIYKGIGLHVYEHRLSPMKISGRSLGIPQGYDGYMRENMVTILRNRMEEGEEYSEFAKILDKDPGIQGVSKIGQIAASDLREKKIRQAILAELAEKKSKIKLSAYKLNAAIFNSKNYTLPVLEMENPQILDYQNTFASMYAAHFNTHPITIPKDAYNEIMNSIKQSKVNNDVDTTVKDVFELLFPDFYAKLFDAKIKMDKIIFSEDYKFFDLTAAIKNLMLFGLSKLAATQVIKQLMGKDSTERSLTDRYILNQLTGQPLAYQPKYPQKEDYFQSQARRRINKKIKAKLYNLNPDTMQKNPEVKTLTEKAIENKILNTFKLEIPRAWEELEHPREKSGEFKKKAAITGGVLGIAALAIALKNPEIRTKLLNLINKIKKSPAGKIEEKETETIQDIAKRIRAKAITSDIKDSAEKIKWLEIPTEEEVFERMSNIEIQEIEDYLLKELENIEFLEDKLDAFQFVMDFPLEYKKDPEFERKHPRGEHGKFEDKPKEEKPGFFEQLELTQDKLIINADEKKKTFWLRNKEKAIIERFLVKNQQDYINQAESKIPVGKKFKKEIERLNFIQKQYDIILKETLKKKYGISGDKADELLQRHSFSYNFDYRIKDRNIIPERLSTDLLQGTNLFIMTGVLVGAVTMLHKFLPTPSIDPSKGELLVKGLLTVPLKIRSARLEVSKVAPAFHIGEITEGYNKLLKAAGNNIAEKEIINKISRSVKSLSKTYTTALKDAKYLNKVGNSLAKKQLNKKWIEPYQKMSEDMVKSFEMYAKHGEIEVDQFRKYLTSIKTDFKAKKELTKTIEDIIKDAQDKNLFNLASEDFNFTDIMLDQLGKSGISSLGIGMSENYKFASANWKETEHPRAESGEFIAKYQGGLNSVKGRMLYDKFAGAEDVIKNSLNSTDWEAQQEEFRKKSRYVFSKKYNVDENTANKFLTIFSRRYRENYKKEHKSMLDTASKVLVAAIVILNLLQMGTFMHGASVPAKFAPSLSPSGPPIKILAKNIVEDQAKKHLVVGGGSILISEPGYKSRFLFNNGPDISSVHIPGALKNFSVRIKQGANRGRPTSRGIPRKKSRLSYKSKLISL